MARLATKVHAKLPDAETQPFHTTQRTQRNTITNQHHDHQQVMMPDGRSVPMTDQFREEIIAKYATMAVRPLRCLALATKASTIPPPR